MSLRRWSLQRTKLGTSSDVARTVYVLRATKKNPEIMPRIGSKIGANLKGKNVLRESKFFPLRAVPVVKKQNIVC